MIQSRGFAVFVGSQPQSSHCQSTQLLILGFSFHAFSSALLLLLVSFSILSLSMIPVAKQHVVPAYYCFSGTSPLLSTASASRVGLQLSIVTCKNDKCKHVTLFRVSAG